MRHSHAAEAQRQLVDRPNAFVGFDGFIDVICTAVAGRSGMEPEAFDPFPGIPAFADRIAASAGRSTNIELVVREERFGGNGPLLAGGLAALGVATTYAGCVADDTDASAVHPTFRAFAARCERVVPLARPSRTECLEFADGKVMFNKVCTLGDAPGSMQSVRWEHVVQRCGGVDAVRAQVSKCSLVGIVNWSIMAGVEDIWAGLTRDVLLNIPPTAAGSVTPRRVLIDLSDPAKRSRADIDRGMKALTRMHAACPVTLGLNLSEAEQVCAVVAGEEVVRAAASGSLADKCTTLAAAVREAIAVECVVVHPREGAAAVRAGPAGAEAVWVDGPFTPTPRLSTGAGDHFNAGLGLGLMLGLPLTECLRVATATSGAYVRDAQSPSRSRVLEVLATF